VKKLLHVLTVAGLLCGPMAAPVAAAGSKDKAANSKPAAGQNHECKNPEECAKKHASGECKGHEPGQPHQGPGHQSGGKAQAKK